MIPNPLHPRRAALLAALLALAACADLPTASAPADALHSHQAQAELAPLHLTFQKTGGEGGVWQGSVSGDIEGALRTELQFQDFRVAGEIWHVRFLWIVDAGAQPLTADLSGTLNTATGRVVMNGVVSDGYLKGAQVHEEGQLVGVDGERTTFAGSIRIMPATAR